ncbi:hypothetical protein Ciccas_001559 [Cichlidogyrus casuarinus]|uniref:Pur-alpha n=1 Tax=Cichlidogyrus casuarinus TaxID=1844966 RepID=A0ABD2QM21_9PLAT
MYERHNVEDDIDSITVQVEKKRFYLDLKRNSKGKFIKIAEIDQDGKKVRIILTMPASLEVKQKLSELMQLLKDLKNDDGTGSTDSGNQGEKSEESDGMIKSHSLVFQKRKYFLDLKHNKRGYFVRLTMLTSSIRVQLAVPEEGLEEFHNALGQLLDKAGTQNTHSEENSISRTLNIANKSLRFDAFTQDHGRFLRISESRLNLKNSIVFPLEYLDKLKDIMTELSLEVQHRSSPDSCDIKKDDVIISQKTVKL